MEPLWPVPYIQGLRAAQRINDLDGIEWATAGILSQGWSAGQSNVWRTALHVSEATLKQLRDEKRTKEAAKFAAALTLAKQRDCVIRVGWTGDADVDLMVEEPTGSVCSLRNYRTTGGGVLCGDVSGIYSLKGGAALPNVPLPQGLQRHLQAGGPPGLGPSGDGQGGRRGHRALRHPQGQDHLREHPAGKGRWPW